MTTPSDSLRHRSGQSSKKIISPKEHTTAAPTTIESNVSITTTAARRGSNSEWDYKLALLVITILAFASRFWGISHPNEVVFDEVHFGKFASYYLQRTYFFDVHPPLGKLLFAFMGWLVGYDGHFLFDNIGDSYISNKVPYVAFRALPALMGSLTVPNVFLIMWESGYSLPAATLAAGLVLFDNAHIGQTRLILLDATLIFAMSLSVLSYVRFYKLRHIPFSRKWWKWLLLTGVSLSCVMSTKYVGVFTFVTVGSAVAIDLWALLNLNRPQGTLSLKEFGKHFVSRAFGLIAVPFFFYLFWFQVHFTILSRSGPGDDFMSPEFQETLSDNIMNMQSVGIQYYDTIVIRHKETKAYLHSHPDRYPLRYDDGRVSSQGQQVTGYPFNDTNNHWQILPPNPLPEKGQLDQNVQNGDIVKLRHIVTNTILLTHDVASPYFPTNQEFTTVSIDDSNGNRHNDSLFEIKIENGKPKQDFKTMSGQFKLVHVPTKVAMWTHTSPLPEWAFKQQEINGNKQIPQTSNIWYVDDIPSLPSDSPRHQKEPRKVKHMPFLKKYIELQRAMFHHNNALTSSHPYASQPIQWPFLMRGVSFWTQNDTRQQIYFLGNPLGWWMTSVLLATFVGIIGADQLSLRRGMHVLQEPSCLVAGSLLELVFNGESFNGPDDVSISSPKPIIKKGSAGNNSKKRLTAKERLSDSSINASWLACGCLLAIVIGGWWYFLPLTYGYPGLTVAEVNARKWLYYDLHFAK
ncbi:MAG: hypothetical protein M1829_001512 [Trizodia sp. TS-e1964]|nr:MAG: hypothetical protein M1829_001512 [Trizodia sp. TS-e1964]